MFGAYKLNGRSFRLLIGSLCLPIVLMAQARKDSSYITMAPGSEYTATPLHQKLFGNHYRTDWNTPVRVKVFYLDTAVGGLVPYQAGGGRQSKSLRLHDSRNREYVLRSIDKTFGRALPPIYQNTFVEKVLNDQVTIAQPFSAVTITQMAAAAKIYHTNPQIVFLPKQKRLDSFNKDFGDRLYLFEERPDENWETAASFGNSKNIIGTDKVLEKIAEDGKHRIDQQLYIRSRLFDMFIGDWGRHEDQWRWASFKTDSGTIYQPIPRDRDQAYTKFDGFIVQTAKAAAAAGYLQTFDHKIKHVNSFNFPARHLDRRMANETTLDQWTHIANELQATLTDDVILRSVKKLPPEMFENSGKEIVAKLKSRRDDLAVYAKEYYLFLAKEVDVPGTKEDDIFEITTLPNDQLSVKVFSASKKNSRPFYERTFTTAETEEVRLYGVGGQDEFHVRGPRSKIKIRLIGAEGQDSYVVEDESKVTVYDDKKQDFTTGNGIRKRLSNDSSVHQYNYDDFKYDFHFLIPLAFYDDDDRLFIGLQYRNLNHQWRKQPFGQLHNAYLHYSITQAAFSAGYSGAFNQVLGKWSLLANANYDFVRWINFFGLGNNTQRPVDDINYYRIRSKELSASLYLEHAIGKQSRFSIGPFLRSVQLLHNPDRFLEKEFTTQTDKDRFDTKYFTGINSQLVLQTLNNRILPTKGITLSAQSNAVKNLTNDKTFANYQGAVKFYLPFLNHFVLAVENGAATVTGQPEFYQLNAIGGSNLRGFNRDRFWGETAFYNQNELQYLFDFRSRIFNGTVGVLGFADQGRVWRQGEISDTWHRGFGGGIIAVPFQQLYVSLQYGVSTENNTIHFVLRRAL